MNTGITRTIEVVKDGIGTDAVFRSVRDVLDDLDQPGVSWLRREVRQAYERAEPRFCCGKCGHPVYLSVSGNRNLGGKDGSQAFFAHHAGAAVGVGKGCAWHTDGGQRADDVDARKFNGALESHQHRALKAILVQMLGADEVFCEVAQERVISRLPNWRKPDVSALMDGREIAFDIQLATTHLPAIVGRERFYEENRIIYVWLVDADNLLELGAQAFADIYWQNDGLIFALDKEALSATLATGELHLQAITIVPKRHQTGVEKRMHKRLVARSEIDWQAPGLRPRLKAQQVDDIAAAAKYSELFGGEVETLFDSLGEKRGERDVGAIWDAIACHVGGPSWEATAPHPMFKVLGVLATAALGRKMNASGFGENELRALINEFLEHEPCRAWSAALEKIAAGYGASALLDRATTQAKIARNLAQTEQVEIKPFWPLLAVLFPRAAAQLRATGPIIPNVA